MKSKVCCMFNDSVLEHVIENKALECLIKDEWSRRKKIIYRCKKCGAYVLYTYEENIFYGGWDNPDINIAYIPIEEPEIVDGRFPEECKRINGACYISTSYREEDWAKDRLWSYGKC